MNEHNFEADISIYPLGPNTRQTSPFNGIRWAFAYADDLKNDGEHCALEVKLSGPKQYACSHMKF